MKITNKYMTYMMNDGIDYTYDDYDYKFTRKALEEHLKSLWEIYKHLEDTNYDSKVVYNLGDIINLVEGLKEEIRK